MDKGNVDNEKFPALVGERVHTRMSWFALSRPKEVDARGLFDCLQTSLRSIGISALSAENARGLLALALMEQV